MPAPLDPDKRQAIEQDIREGTLSRNAIARKHDVSGATVSKIGKNLEADGVAPLCDRSQTKHATRARAVDIEARRVEFAGLLADDWLAIRERMWELQTQPVVVPVKGGGATVQLVQVPGSSTDFKNYATALGILVDKVRVLTETDSGAQEAVSLLGTLVGDIRARRTTVVPDAAQ